jgi:hypothetical protein
VITMEKNSLFDPERRRGLLKAVREGKGISAQKGQVEPPLPVPKNAPLMEITSKCFFASNPPLIQAGARRYQPNEFLVLAIQFCDLEAVRFALSLRADVNHRFTYLPTHPSCTDNMPTLISYGQMSPLHYAKFEMTHPRADIIELLEKNGAKD